MQEFEPTLPPQGAGPSTSFVTRKLRTAMGLEDFLVGGVLAEGGMGVVEFARQKSLDRDVVLKRPRNPDNPLNVAELLREARVAGRLEHPSIVTIHGVYRDEQGHPVVCMRAAPGHTWQSKQHISLDEHVRIAISICRAMEFAHAHGVLHLDLKPSNVVVGPRGEVCLVDWGVAMDRIAEPVRTQLLGTPSYMAPEMVQLGPLDERTDVYLLGGCLYFALYGSPPHPRETPSLSMSAAMERPPFPAPSAEEHELVAICARALDPDPDARFPDMSAMRAALERYLEYRNADRLVEQIRRRHQQLSPALGIHERLEALRALRKSMSAALALAPGHPAALHCRDTLSVEMARLHLQVGQPDAATRLVEMLQPLPLDLAAALGELRPTRRGALDRWQERMLRRLLITTPLLTAIGQVVTTFDASIDVSAIMAGQVTASSLVWAFLLWLDPPPVHNRRSFNFQVLIWSALLGLLANVLVGALAGLSPAQTASAALLLLGTLVFTQGWVRPSLFLVGPAVWMMALLPRISPTIGRVSLAFGVVALLLYGIFLLRFPRKTT